ncbi:Transposase DDE domain-containing protein [Paracoccus halophilus]|nr:Transposase DDE domain-containing protein [Paracoccus halophilus]
MQLVWLDKVLFGVPLRQRTGMVIILLRMAGLDFSSLSRRQKASTAQITNRRAAGPLNVLIDNEARTMCW